MKRTAYSLACALSVTFLFIAALAFGQKTGTSRYLPQINLTATNGFGPYVIGNHQENAIVATDLPPLTSRAMFRFIDADSNQVGMAYIVTGTSLNSISWHVRPDTMNLPLSPQFHLELTYNADSIANYYIPYTVYPDTVIFGASKGWGPFITNAYPFSDPSWNPVPPMTNDFMVKNLPPRTDTVIFQILRADSTVVSSQIFPAQSGHYLDSAIYSNVRMDNLPLSTQYLRALIHADGAPDKGLEFHKLLTTALQKPNLVYKSGGVTLTDSIPAMVENPVAGQALLVDSMRYAAITNGPGVKMTNAPYIYQGPYSFDIRWAPFTIEGWINIDGPKLAAHPGKSMSFMRVDSLFDLSLYNEDGLTSGLRFSSLLGGQLLEMFYIEAGNQVFQQKGWHHFAFVAGDPRQRAIFYFDGVLLGSYGNSVNINYIFSTYNVNNYLKTKPLILGGCNAGLPANSRDYSFITGMDEIRIWNRYLTQNELINNMNKVLLQESSLTGYWNFDDLRNRLNFISDLSYMNNSGQMKNGAAFVPEYAGLYTVNDTLILHSSNANTDTVQFAFLDINNHVVDSVKVKVQNHAAQLVIDISSLPYTVVTLRIREIYPGCTGGGFTSAFNMTIRAPSPVATPQTNWGVFYNSGGYGSLDNPILVNGLPDNTTKVVMGLKNGTSLYNVDSDTMNAVPYQYSLALNGTDNYIQTSKQIASPANYEISLWFKTTTTTGGELIGFCDSPNGVPVSAADREIYMEKDGSLRFTFQSSTGPVTLYGSNRYNDGFWHCVTVRLAPPASVDLLIDNSMVDQKFITTTIPYLGYWVIGRDDGFNKLDKSNRAPFFKGSLAYITIWTSSKSKTTVHDPALLNGAFRGSLLYKLDEGTGNLVHDSQGTNAAMLQGATQNWSKTNKVSMVRWQHNMLDKAPGTYTFYSTVFYPGSGTNGVTYPLGTFTIADPLPGYSFTFNLSNGNGYFNEGENLYNTFYFTTNYTGQGQSGWKNNFVRYYLLTPGHQVVDQNIYTWTPTGFSGSLVINMGAAPPGSYLNIQTGYETTGNSYIVAGSFSIPLLIRPMMAPAISGDFGPFEQAIAPGTMVRQNTFNIFEENLTALSKVTGTFYDSDGNLLATANGVHVNDTTWQITENMAILSPPESYMRISYFLGTNNYLALVAGPYKIEVHKTRPDWFDMIGDSAFSNINESGDNVTFRLATPFDASYLINNSTEMDIPQWVPLIGESSCRIDMPTGQVYLKYIKSQSQLMLNEPPDFFQKVFNLGAGNASTLSFTFNYAQNNKFELDARNNLYATQNFSTGGSLTSGFNKFANIVEKIQEIIKVAEVSDPESVIVSPSFELTYTGSFQYSSRLHLMVDSLTGKWGSFGNLNVDANPAHSQAFNNSASYHFYSGALGMEFAVGAELLEGLLSGHFGLDGRFLLGFGHSYVSIPKYQSKPLKSFAFQTYGRFYIDIFWGWYEKTLWGPKMFYSTTIWGDDMTNAFPPAGKKKALFEPIPAQSSWPELADKVRPVSSFSRIPVARPQASVHATDNHVHFNWLEKGESFGERKLCHRYLDFSAHRFSTKRTIEVNHYALNSPASDAPADSIEILSWAQSRHTENSFSAIVPTNPVQAFVKSQDIWFAVYNTAKDSLIQMNRLEDDISTLSSGRAEANPRVTLLSSSRALITWQVMNFAANKADIWYVLLTKNGPQWTQTPPAIAVTGSDVMTQIKVSATAQDKAVMVWLNTSKGGTLHNTIKFSVFDGTSWSAPDLLSAPDDKSCNYLDVRFRGERGGLAYTKFVEDTVNGHYEKLVLIPWLSGNWKKALAVDLLVDSVNHLQLPKLAICKDGIAAVAVKREKMITKSENQRISQIDVFKGDISQPSGVWHHAEANPYICDTTRQISELNIAFITTDTLLVLTQEYPMLAVNAASIPSNGIVFGDPYMNQVLRCFSIRDDGSVVDVDENNYFLGIPGPGSSQDNKSVLQCYPNPCTDHATVRFDLTGPSLVTMELYNIQGSRVATLIRQDMSTGLYEIDLNTSLLKPGTYVCRLLTGDTVHSLKLIVAK